MSSEKAGFAINLPHMKEQLVRLTTQTEPSYALYRGKIMPEVSSVETGSKIEKVQAKAQAKKESLEKRKKKLEEAVKKPLKKLEEKLEKKPLEKWTKQELVDGIKEAAAIQRRANFQKQGLIGGLIFSESSEASELASQYQAKLREEAKREKEQEFLEKIDAEIAEEAKNQRETEDPSLIVYENAALEDDVERVSRAQQLLEKEELTRDQETAILRAHNVGISEMGRDGGKAGIYNFTLAQIREKNRILAEAGFSEDERRALLEAGIAGAPLTTDQFSDVPQIGAIVQEVNREANRIGDREINPDYLEKQRDRVQRLIDQGVISGVQLGRAQDFIELLNERIENEEGRVAAQRREERVRQGQRGEDEEEFLKDADIKDSNGNEMPGLQEETYKSQYVKDIVQEIKEKVGRGDGRDTLLKQYESSLSSKVSELSRTQDISDQDKQTIEDIDKAIDVVRELRSLMEKRSREKRFNAMSNQSFYGELKMSPKERRELIESALLSEDPTVSDFVREREKRKIDKAFNELFAGADTKAGLEWREALGQPGSIEVTDFINTLATAATGRMTYGDRELTQEERERIDYVARRLGGELKLREDLHTLSFFVNQAANAEQVHKFMNNFQSTDADRAFRQTGVSQAFHFYEQAMLQVMARNGGYLPASAMVSTPDGKYGEVEALVRESMERAGKMGIFGENGIDTWEVGRAISLARGMGIVTGRWFEIAAVAGLPRGRPLVSWWANRIVSNMAFFRQVARYNIGMERNRFLAIRLEKGSRAWSTKELTEVGSLNDAMENWIIPSEKGDRYVDMINPFRIGSIYTQTGWRWGPDKVNQEGAVSHILKHDPTSSIIGAGLWVEKERGALSSHEHFHKTKKVLGKDVNSRAEEAHAIIHHHLETAAEVSPLKFFYALNTLRLSVLRRKEIASRYGDNYIQEFSENRKQDDPNNKVYDQVVIRSKDLNSDLEMLAIVQEKTLKNRTKIYKKFLDEAEKYGQAELNGTLTEEQKAKGKPVSPDTLEEGHPDFDEYRKLDFSGLDSDQQKRVASLAHIIKEEFEKSENGKQSILDELMTNLHDKGWKVPFVLGTDDIPHDMFEYAKTEGDAFRRRWADIEAAAKGASAYASFISNMADFHDQEGLIKGMREIYSGLSGHDENVARETMERTAEAVIKYFKKDWTARLPGGVGTLLGITTQKTSFAQVAFGPNAMAWDEGDIDTFIKKLHGLVDHHQTERLRKRTGAELWNIVLAGGRTAIPLSLFAFIYYLFSKEADDIQGGGHH